MNMNSLLSINKSGLQGLQTKLDITASNIANVNTVGYKQNDATFQELLHNSTTDDEVRLSDRALNSSISRGIKASNQSVNFIQGGLMNTSSPTDLAITGDGFFGVRDATNQLYLTRAGDFHRDANGGLVTSNGMRVEIQERVPQNQWPAGDLSISKEGQITIHQGNTSLDLGKIILYRPQNAESLRSAGGNLFQVEQNQPLTSSVDQPADFGMIESAKLENSTVDLADSMTELMVTQRAYSLNLKSLETSDGIAGIINRLSE